MAPNKTLAAQLCNEFREFLPDNAVEYFVSYYDYYQPEAYLPATRHLHREGLLHQPGDRPAAPRGHQQPAHARRRGHRGLGLLHLRPGLAGGVPGPGGAAQGGRRDQPRRGLRQAGEDPLRAQRHRLRPGQVPGAGRQLRGVAGLRRLRPAGEPVGRPGGGDRQGRPADPGGHRPAAQRGHLPGHPLRHLARTPSSARWGRSPRSSRHGWPSWRRRASSWRPSGCASAPSTTWRCCASSATATASRTTRASWRAGKPGRAAVHAARLLPRRLPGAHRRVAHDRAAAARHVPRRPQPQDHAGGARLPPAVGPGQPAAALRGVHGEGAAGGVRVGHAGRVGDLGLQPGGGAAGAAHRPGRPRGGGAAHQAPDRRSHERDPRPRGARGSARW